MNTKTNAKVVTVNDVIEMFKRLPLETQVHVMNDALDIVLGNNTQTKWSAIALGMGMYPVDDADGDKFYAHSNTVIV